MPWGGGCVLEFSENKATNKPRVRGPPLCVRVSEVRVKMNLWQKVFFAKNHVKITKSQPPLWGDGRNSENVI